MTGFYKVDRELLHTKLLKDPSMLQVWSLLSSVVRFTETEIDGIRVLPGQVLLSVHSIAAACNLTDHTVRCALERLEKQNLIRRQNVRYRYSLITMLDASEQAEPQPTAPSEKKTPETKKAPAKKCVIEPEENNATQPAAAAEETPAKQAENAAKRCYGMCKNVYMTTEEKSKLQERSTVADVYIDKLSFYKQRTGKKYESDFLVLCEWICKDEIEKRTTAEKAEQSQSVREKERFEKERQNAFAYRTTDFFHSPASYDLEAAEKQARENVPVLRKRR